MHAFLRSRLRLTGFGLVATTSFRAHAIRGTVRNDRTGALLAGAKVTLLGRPGVSTTTERDGSFTPRPVPPGPQRIRVRYTGLDPHEAEVVVPVAGTAAVDVGLGANKAGADIVGIGLRGTPPELNAVTVDGTRSAYPVIGYVPQGDRAVAIDQIPSESIKETGGTKGNRPENSADTLGGAINRVPKSAFDYRSRVMTYRAGVNQHTYCDRMRMTPTAAATYMDTFSGRRLGVALSASCTETVNTRDRVRMSHLDPDVRNSRARLNAGFSGRF